MIKLEAIKNQHLEDLHGAISTGLSTSGYSELEDGLIKDLVDVKSKTDIYIENARVYIRLCKYVYNPLLALTSDNICSKVLNIPDAKDILDFKRVYDKRTNTFVNVSDIITDVSSNYLIGAEIVKKYIEEFDIEASIKDCYLNLIADKFYKVKDYNEIGTISKYTGEYRLYGVYYFNPNESCLNNLKKQYIVDDIVDFFDREYIYEKSTRLYFLLNMKDKKGLEGLVNDFVIVMPLGMRPSITGRHDGFTAQYLDILNKNSLLSLTLKGSSYLEEVLPIYQKLQLAINKLLYKSDIQDITKFSILEKLSGKTGLIRSEGLGFRVDNSGRSVIVADPKLKVNQCGIPKTMLPKLYWYHYLKGRPTEEFREFVKEENVNESVEKLLDSGIINEIPVILNRAPTLHKLSFLGFDVVPTDDKVIHLNSVQNVQYNADFDGDQMAVHIPLHKEAIEEVKHLMLTTHNAFSPASGACMFTPRHEMLLGLSLATKDYELKGNTKVYNNYNDLYKDVMDYTIAVDQKVSINGKIGTAGKLAMYSFLPESIEIKEIKKKTAQELVEHLSTLTNYTDFLKGIDGLVEYGFGLATLYSPNMTTLEPLVSETLENPFEGFYNNLSDITKDYERGLIGEESYNLIYSEYANKVESMIGKEIKKIKNGYSEIINSGARGSDTNLIQIYGYKGKIKKSAYESFNFIIQNSFRKGLTSLEGFLSAFGTRCGAAEKVRKTADTGYASRTMWHTTESFIITCDDCGSTDGLEINKEYIEKFLHIPPSMNGVAKKQEVEKQIVKILLHRWTVDGDYISKDNIEKFLSMPSVFIRSPLTCKKPCCSKCYGDDLSIHGRAVSGTPVGIIAAQSIGEPGTQLTMKTFQKGGIVTKTDITSDFDKVQAYINMVDLSKKPQGFLNYDPIAWTTGKVLEIPNTTDTKKIQIEGSKKYVILPSELEVKHYVVKGEGVCLVEGEHSVVELEKYCGIDKAQKYLLYTLYTTYLDEADINIKNFEILVAGMTLYKIIRSDIDELRPLSYYQYVELANYDLANTDYIRTLVGVKKVPFLSTKAFSEIKMEYVGQSLSRSVLMGLEDDLSSTLTSILFGARTKIGTGYNENYIEERLKEERQW